MVADHLSQLKNEEVTKEESEVKGEFPDEFLLQATTRPWFADVAKDKATGVSGRNFYIMPASMYGMIHICSS